MNHVVLGRSPELLFPQIVGFVSWDMGLRRGIFREEWPFNDWRTDRRQNGYSTIAAESQQMVVDSLSRQTHYNYEHGGSEETRCH